MGHSSLDFKGQNPISSQSEIWHPLDSPHFVKYQVEEPGVRVPSDRVNQL
jgi:hypothetical protein